MSSLVLCLAMANKMPYVSAACICERVITEPDNVNSLIRIVDTYTLQTAPSAVPLGITPALNLTVYVSVKAGDVRGEHEIGIVLRRPSGKGTDPQKWPVVLTGEPESGVNLKLEFGLAGEPGKLPETGLYWFDVTWNGKDLTSIPLKLKQADATSAPAVPSKP